MGMTVGLEVNSNDGAKRLGLNGRMYKFFGVASVGQSYTGNQSSGVIQHGLFNFYPGNRPFAFMLGGRIEVNGYACQFSFANDLLTWSFKQSTGDPGMPWTRPDTVFTYGIW